MRREAMDIVIGEREVLTAVSADWMPFGLSIADRRQHVLLLGKTGVGKSTLLRNMLIQDIQAGRGCLFIDPHGDEAERLLDYVPPWRTEDVVYLDPSELSCPVGFNILEREPAEHRDLIASNVTAIFRHFWADAWGARSEYILLCAVLAVLDYPDSCGDVSLLAVQRILSDPDYRARVVGFSRNQAVRTFWLEEFPGFTASFAAESLAPLQNKLGALFSADATRLLLGQATGGLKLPEAMDGQKIVIVRLPKGLIGEDKTNLVGSLIVSAVQHAAMRRAAIPEEERTDFVCYLDECQNFTTDAFAQILSELRKYHVGFVLSGQFLAQQRPPVRAAMMGNIGTLVSFQLGHEDAEELDPVFSPYGFDTLTGLRRGQVAVRVTRDGEAQQPFLGYSYAETGRRYADRRTAIREQSRRRYGCRRELIEEKLARWNPPRSDPEPRALARRTRQKRPTVLVNIENFYNGQQ